jgi:hypothetical protein
MKGGGLRGAAWLLSILLLALNVAVEALAHEVGAASAALRPLQTIELFPVGVSETVSATYGSHNQKTAVTPFGIFFTYVDRLRNGLAHWRLMRTRDQGASFDEVWAGVSIAGAPVLETDGRYLFLVVPSDRYPDGTFMRFDAAGKEPFLTKTIAGGGDGHYNLLYDAQRRRLLYTASVYAFAINLDGEVIERIQLFPYVDGSRMEESAHYPVLAQDNEAIALANTTTPFPGWTGRDGRSNNCYPSFGNIHSADGGKTWTNPQNQQQLQLPFDSSQNGPSYHPLDRAVTEMTPDRCMANWFPGSRISTVGF